MRRLAPLLLLVSGLIVSPNAGARSSDGAYTYRVEVRRAERPAQAELRLIVGGTPHGSFENGRDGKRRFVIQRLSGGILVWTRVTPTSGRLSFDIGRVCREYPDERYFIRASLAAEPRAAFVNGHCKWVVRTLDARKRATVTATFRWD
jgi:hypothetical protein